MHISGERASAGTAADALADARTCLSLAREASLPQGDALQDFVVEAAQLEAQVQALRLRAAAEIERRQRADAEGATDAAALLAHLTGDRREVMQGGLFLARRLEETYHATLCALTAGRISMAAARVIVDAADMIPDWATPSQVADAEEWLIAKATGDGNRHGRPLNPSRLRQAARRMCRQVDTELADAHEAAMLNKEKRHAEAETWLTLHDNGDGTFSGRFVIPELHGKLLRRFLEQLSAPRRWARDRQGQPANDPTAGRGFNWSEELGLGFLELLENLPSGGWSRNGINVVVTMTLDNLRNGLGGAGLDDGTRISSSDARRLCCNAGILPAVLGGRSEPLDLGRARRIHTRHQRIALSLLHDSCAVVGCDRPFAWCEIHHPHQWADGGPTDLANAVPLCGYHHRRAHDTRWDLHEDNNGLWRFRSSHRRWSEAA